MTAVFLEEMLRHTHAGYLLVDKHGVVRFINERCRQILQLPNHHLFGSSLEDLVPRWSNSPLAEAVAAALESRISHTFRGPHIQSGFRESALHISDQPGFQVRVGPFQFEEHALAFLEMFPSDGFSDVVDFVQKLPVPVMTLDQSHILFANPAACELLEYGETTALCGQWLADRVADPALMDQWIGHVIEKKTTVYQTTELLTRTGRSIPVSFYLSTLEGPNGRRLVFIPQLMETAAEKNTPADAALTTIPFEENAAGMWLCDRRLNLTAVNHTLCEWLGFRKEELIGRPLGDLLLPDQQAFLLDPLRRNSDQRRFHLEISVMTAAKTTLQCVLEVTVDRDNHGAVRQAFAVVVDITSLLQMESQSYLTSVVFDATGEAIVVINNHNTIQAVNPAFCSMTGYQSEAINDAAPEKLIAPHQRHGFAENILPHLEQTGKWEGELWFQRKSGENFPSWCSITATYHHGQSTQFRYVMVFADITKRNESEAIIRRQANFDPLTELPNRILFMDRLGQALELAKRMKTKAALLFIDLDRFKLVNDSLGHAVGDILLQEAAVRLRDCARSSDTVARLGGDEFTIILPNLKESHHAEVVARKALAELAKPFNIEGHQLYISGSIGITLYPDDGDSIRDLLKQADTAMYGAKEAGRNAFRFFTPAMNLAAQDRLRLEGELRRSMDLGELMLYFQPILATNERRVVGCEALLRWCHPTRNIVPPGQFISLAEETGLIIPIGEWVLRQSCYQARRWLDQGYDLHISVNISTRQFREQDFRQVVESVLSESGLPPQSLVLEITESLVLEETEQLMEDLKLLTAKGLRFSVDDFGTGYSSLSYLRRFPAKMLKIERSFLQEVVHRRDDAALVEAMISLAHKLNMTVVAEGVETLAQWDFLKECDCDFMQGFYFSRPLPVTQMDAFLADHFKETPPNPEKGST
ncbi:sensor domain-containing protein [Acanthopleuribacter pedis]|uniref:EAL domain-containing protein n=1 Tax=Acanthopleuribacter pedis TaxID=442870 RepID=A0A8J7Q365_9BACT|nr:EAL domain-containing protein [Acanthopleuribacter pedis]MBO1318405.1 EAL domain-containing protein [Acanthopleuribacter pedis]